MNRQQFHMAFTGVATVNAGLTTYVIIKGVQLCVAGLFAPAMVQFYIAGIGVYTVYGSMKSIKKLEGK